MKAANLGPWELDTNYKILCSDWKGVEISGLPQQLKIENVFMCEIYEIESARREKLMNARLNAQDKSRTRTAKFFGDTRSASTTNIELHKKSLQLTNREHTELKIKPKISLETPRRPSIQFENKQLDSIENQINTHLKELETNRGSFRIAESYFSSSTTYLDDLENFNPSALYRCKKLENLYKSEKKRKKPPFYRNSSSYNFDYRTSRPDFEYGIKPNPIRSNNFLFNPSIIDSEFFLDNDGLTEIEKIRNQLKEDYAKIPNENRVRSVSSQKSAGHQKLTNNKNLIDFSSTLQLKEKLRAIAQKHQIKNFYLNQTSTPNSLANSASSSKLKTLQFKNSVFKQEDELIDNTRVKSSLNFVEIENDHKITTPYRSESFLNINSQIMTKPKIVGYTDIKTSTVTAVKPTDNPLARLNFTFLRSSSINRPFVIDNSTQNSFRNPISINGRSYFLTSDDVNKRNLRFINKTSKVQVDGKLTKLAENKEQETKREEFGTIIAVSKSGEKIKLSA